MSKKDAKKVMCKAVREVGSVLTGMVTAPGSRKATGIPRAEVAALSFGLSMGLGVGALMQADREYAKAMEKDPVDAAAFILSRAMEDWPEQRDEILSKGWDSVKSVRLMGVRRDG